MAARDPPPIPSVEDARRIVQAAAWPLPSSFSFSPLQLQLVRACRLLRLGGHRTDRHASAAASSLCRLYTAIAALLTPFLSPPIARFPQLEDRGISGRGTPHAVTYAGARGRGRERGGASGALLRRLDREAPRLLDPLLHLSLTGDLMRDVFGVVDLLELSRQHIRLAVLQLLDRVDPAVL
jgi:hypothetical protein